MKDTCPKCWDSPCSCGYQNWTEGRKTELINAIFATKQIDKRILNSTIEQLDTLITELESEGVKSELIMKFKMIKKELKRL